VTLLIGQGRQTLQVQEAMRRVDWEFVALEGPLTVRKLVGEIQRIQDHSRTAALAAPLAPSLSGLNPLRSSSIAQSAMQKSFDGFSGQV